MALNLPTFHSSYLRFHFESGSIARWKASILAFDGLAGVLPRTWGNVTSERRLCPGFRVCSVVETPYTVGQMYMELGSYSTDTLKNGEEIHII